VLVQERIYGIPIRDMEALKSAKTNIKTLAENGVEIFFTQVFHHNFFHADMHPGNIFVQVEDPKNPKYAAVDFGIMGTLSASDQYYLAENFLAFFDRDYYKIAKLHIDSGWVPPDTRIDELETAVRTVCDPIFNKPLSEISFAQVLLGLFETAQQFDMEIQPQLILLQKTLFNIEGLGRELYPELDLWKTAQPILRSWMDEQVGVNAIVKNIRDNLPQLRETLREMPNILKKLTTSVNDNDSHARQSLEIQNLKNQLYKQQKQRFFISIGSTAIISATLILLFSNITWLGWLLIILGITSIFFANPKN